MYTYVLNVCPIIGPCQNLSHKTHSSWALVHGYQWNQWLHNAMWAIDVILLFWLVVWNLSIFPYIGNFMIPTDELIFFRGVGIPPTSVDRFWKNVLFFNISTILYGYIMFIYIYTHICIKHVSNMFFFYFHVCYLYPYAPWCWYIYLQNWAMFGVNVGKYASTMEHMGYIPCHTRPTLVIFGTTNLGTRQYSTRWQVDRWEHPKKAPCFP